MGLIDLQGVPGLDRIQVEGDWLEIGSMATFAGLLQNSLVEKNACALWLACRSMGAPQIRNQATIGGNLGNCSPAVDSLPALLALGAEAIDVMLVNKSDGELLKWVMEIIIMSWIY